VVIDGSSGGSTRPSGERSGRPRWGKWGRKNLLVRERIRARRHRHCSDRVRTVSGSTARVRPGRARLRPRSVCAVTRVLDALEKTAGWAGLAGHSHRLGPAQSGLGCTVDTGWPGLQFSNIQ
jgi:hypothetical protein